MGVLLTSDQCSVHRKSGRFSGYALSTSDDDSVNRTVESLGECSVVHRGSSRYITESLGTSEKSSVHRTSSQHIKEVLQYFRNWLGASDKCLLPRASAPYIREVLTTSRKCSVNRGDAQYIV